MDDERANKGGYGSDVSRLKNGHAEFAKSITLRARPQFSALSDPDPEICSV